MSEVDRHLPLTPLTYQILIALADSPRHGYGILKEIERRGTGAVPSTGALYLAVQRMEGEGLIEESCERPAGEADDARRRYYRLTALGRAVVRAESRRLALLVEVAREKALLEGGAGGAAASAGGGDEG